MRRTATAPRCWPPCRVRQALLKRLDALTAEASVGTPVCRGAFCYVSRRAAGAQVSIIYRRPAAGGAEQAVFDPLQFAPDKLSSAAFLDVSNDGRLLAYALRRGGEDETSIRFRDLSSGKDIPAAIARHLNRGFALREDGKGCYYTNHDRQSGPRIRYLDLSNGQEKLIFGEGFSPSEFISPRLLADGRYLLITAGRGWASNDLYWMDLEKDAAPKPIVKGIERPLQRHRRRRPASDSYGLAGTSIPAAHRVVSETGAGRLEGDRRRALRSAGRGHSRRRQSIP